MEDQEFYQRATLHITSSLHFKKYIQNTLAFFQPILPVDAVFLHVFEPGLEATRLVYLHNGKQLFEPDEYIPIPEPERGMLAWPYDSAVVHVAHPEGEPIARHFVPRLEAILGTGRMSFLVIRLRIDGQNIGHFGLVAAAPRNFEDEHLRLLSLITRPLGVAVCNELRYREMHRLRDLLAEENQFLHHEIQRMAGGAEIIGAGSGLRGVVEMIRQLSTTETPVLINGETGVGKEVIANAIQAHSPRAQGPYIKINCGAIPEALMDSELFGHEKGAFTGAVAGKKGRFERAHKGTIFLDEVGELPLQAQVRLLRVLQNHEIERVGGQHPLHVDIRVIAATHRDLLDMVRKGTFREDLYYRLCVFPLSVPPLRQRLQDIPQLVDYFVRKKSESMKLPDIPSLEPGSLEVLLRHRWPGNVRELENIVERAIILSREGSLSFAGLLAPCDSGSEPDADAGMFLSLDEAMAIHIRRALDRTGGRVQGAGGAARLLKINPNTLRKRMDKLAIAYGRKAGKI